MKYICIGTLVIAAIGLLYFWPASASIIFGAILLAGYFAWKSYAGSLSANNSSAWSNRRIATGAVTDAKRPMTKAGRRSEAGSNPAALTLSAGAVPSTLPKTPVTPLCPVAAPAVPAASISAGANVSQQAKPSASVRSAASADSILPHSQTVYEFWHCPRCDAVNDSEHGACQHCGCEREIFTNTEENHPSTLLAEAGANGLRHSPDGIPPKGLGRPEDKPLMRNPMELMICSRPTGSTASNNFRKPRWALTPGTIARLNDGVLK